MDIKYEKVFFEGSVDPIWWGAWRPSTCKGMDAKSGSQLSKPIFSKSKKHSKGWTAFLWTLVAFLGSPRMSLNGPVNDTHLTSPSPKLPYSNMICRLLNLITFMRDITIMTNCQLINLELAIYKWVKNVQFPWSPIIRYWSLSPKINTEKRNKCARLNDFHCYTSVTSPMDTIIFWANSGRQQVWAYVLLAKALVMKGRMSIVTINDLKC